MTQNRFIIRAHIAADPADVYRALVDPMALTRWFAERAEVSMPDGHYEFWGRFTPNGKRHRQRLLAYDPDHLLRVAWLIGDRERLYELALEPEGDGTSLYLVQDDPPPWEFDAANLSDFWFLSTANLANYCEGLDLADRHDFTASYRGKGRAEIVIRAPAAQVFGALIETDQLDRWIAGKAIVEPWVGGRYEFGWDHGPARVVEYAPNRVLAYSWRIEGRPDTLVRWELTETSYGAVRVSVVHSGFGDYSAQGYQIGWQNFLIELKRMHELGHAWRRIEWE